MAPASVQKSSAHCGSGKAEGVLLSLFFHSNIFARFRQWSHAISFSAGKGKLLSGVPINPEKSSQLGLTMYNLCEKLSEQLHLPSHPEVQRIKIFAG